MSAVAKLFMKVNKSSKDGEMIKGESVTEGYEGQIELEDWSWELERDRATHGHDAKAEPSVFSFTKFLDSSTTAMLNATKAGTLHAQVTLDDFSDSQLKLSLILEGVRVVGYSLTGKTDRYSGTVEEQWEFNYEYITLDYKPAERRKPGATGTSREGVRSIKLHRAPDASTDFTPRPSSLLDATRPIAENQREREWTNAKAELAREELESAKQAKTKT